MYSIVDGLEVEVNVAANPFGLELDQLFGMAARINKKRGFLFVSKLLGKHIPVIPSASLGAGAMLGRLYAAKVMRHASSLDADRVRSVLGSREEADAGYRELMAGKIPVQEPTLFIGFAETATALGHSLFDAFEGSVSFVHTTREEIDGLVPSIRFEEEHSHAVAHRCYVRDPSVFRDAARVVLVDDEITTGKTALNIVRELHAAFGHRDFVVASLLDWRSEADRARFAELERELGVRIRCLALIEGSITVKGSPLEEGADGGWEETAPQPGFRLIRHDLSPMFQQAGQPAAGRSSAGSQLNSYLLHTGRFGMSAADGEALDREVARAAEYLAERRTGRRILCLGTGEFMYVPMRIAHRMGDGAYSQSTTRSPIHPLRREGYAVSSSFRFDAVDGEDVSNFIYNVEPGMYDEAFVFVERPYDPKRGASFERALSRIGVPVVHLIFFGGPDERRDGE
ncbi:phosphoribosyltransferase family protein [Cohnella hongkongensis]|uniref:Phosphoribosyltransferase family protein n=1 Tax=Cohnella hongkongensis TaxID=178337 RepID=A0ABV9FBS0_9BACL